MNIVDDNGNNRFKNGIFVDNFVSHLFGQIDSPDYRIVVDRQEKSIRPMYTAHSFYYDYLAAESSNVQKTGNLITLPYTEALLLEQPAVTSYRNIELTSYRFVGTMTLQPDIDVWIEVDAGFYLDPKPKGLVIHIATDPHVLDYNRQRELADYFFCMQTPYMKEGDYFLPYAFEPGVHYEEESVEKVYDASLIGLHYPQRTEWINKLNTKGLHTYYDLGPIFDEYRHLLNQTKIGLNWSSKDDLVARVWELMGMGIPVVTNYVPDIGIFFEDGTHYLGFNDIDGAVDAVMEIYRNPEIGYHIAEKAKEAVKEHTYDHRIEKIFEISGLK